MSCLMKRLFLTLALPLVLIAYPPKAFADGTESTPSEKPVTGDASKIWQALFLGSSLIVAGTLWLGKTSTNEQH